METWSLLQAKKTDLKTSKENEEKKWRLKIKSIVQHGLSLILLKILSKASHIKENIGKPKKVKIGKRIYQIYITKIYLIIIKIKTLNQGGNLFENPQVLNLY